ncbi:MAG: YgjV family protein [Alphaproteobacteria bacterium]|nr:YgjV family protein [Alphaproteobacteria bacterium]
MAILGYIFTALNYLIYCVSRFMPSKKTMLLLDLLSKILMAIGLYFLNSLSGAYMTIAIFFMLIVANIKEQLNKKWAYWYVFFQGLYFLILFFTYEGFSSILITATVSTALFSVWWLQPQQMRLISFLNGFTYLAYQISIKNWAGLLEIFLILSNFLSFFKYRKCNKKNKNRP